MIFFTVGKMAEKYKFPDTIFAMREVYLYTHTAHKEEKLLSTSSEEFLGLQRTKVSYHEVL
jgi:hypothetical protein